ncbi:GspH/FimT family pseudopilin [Cysteiniphilum halobium]|uniref:GspH/FimT family pseudopilin n=1 Tax=Cysteiniphilum halobium TaxID=2219059 RepID=UPI000E65B582|nr:GspH/FimT family pseudopilin [Cysteiniphilum halobium]
MKMKKNGKKGKNNKRVRNLGFSLIEGMIVIAVMAIVIAVAVPLMVGTFGRANSEIYLDKVKAALELGRITAMSEATSVFLCPSSDGATCATVPASNWGNNRLILFTSSDGVSTDVDRIITTIEPPTTGEYMSSSNGDTVEFRPNGLSSTAVSLFYCAIVDGQGAGRYDREVVINMIGRIRLDIYSDSQICP